MKRLRLADFLRPGDCCHHAHCRMRPILPVPPHIHDFHEVFWVEDGGGVHLINGTRQPLRAGQLMLIRPRDAHCFEGAATFTNVAFASSRWERLTRHYVSAPVRGPRCLPRAITLSPFDQRELGSLALELAGGNRGALTTDRFLLKVLALLSGAPRTSPLRRAPPGWVATVLQTVSGEPRHFQSTRSLAALAGYSPEHVARALRRFTGRTPTEVINEARMIYAARRLTDGEDDILTIALDCGFQSLGHFYRLFLRAYGMPPDAFRRHHLAIIGRDDA